LALIYEGALRLMNEYHEFIAKHAGRREDDDRAPPQILARIDDGRCAEGGWRSI
jgi:hypothetical protein